MGLKAYLLLALLVVVLIAILIGLELFKNNDEASVEPKSLAMTFKGDPRTSRAFTWYTNNPDTGAVLQIAKGSDIRSFDGNEVMTFAGESAKLDTGKVENKAFIKPKQRDWSREPNTLTGSATEATTAGASLRPSPRRRRLMPGLRL